MIKRIRICDFKSIRELELDLDPVTVLVGRAGTGKSNIVQAIRFLRNMLLDLNEAVAFEGGWQRIVPVGSQQPHTSIEVFFFLPGEAMEYSYRVAFNPPTAPGGLPGQHHLVAERLALGQEPLFSRTIRSEIGWAWEAAPKVAVPPPQLGMPMLGSFPSLEKVVLAYAGLSTGIGYYHFPSSTLGALANPGPGQEILQRLQGLSDNAGNYRDVIRGITQDFRHPGLRKGLLATLQALNPNIVSVELDSLLSPQRVVVGHDAAGRIFELALEQESDGLRRFCAHLLALYQTQPKSALIFEEPESAIFPGALALLADEFKAAPRDNRGQVILTTHSPILLDSFDVESIRVVEMEDGKTILGRVAKEQRDAVKDRLLTTGELLTVEQPRVERAPEVKRAA